MTSARISLILLSCSLLVASAPACRADDPLPQNAVSFFNLGSCPVGWEALVEARSRLLVPMVTGIGTPVPGGPIGAPSQHIHQIRSSVSLPPVTYAVVAGCGAHCVSAAGTYPLEGETPGAGDDLPYVRFLACLKVDPPSAVPIPPGMMSFFYLPRDCPKGWTQVIAASGRILVGLPGQGTPGAAFGGPALSPGEMREHSHHFSGTLSTRIQEVAAASGGLAGGYGAKGSYAFDNDSEASPSGWPYLQLLLCSKDP